MATRTAEREQFLGDIITGAIEAGWPWFGVERYQYVNDIAEPAKLVACVGGFIEGEDGTAAIVREMDDDETGYKDERLTLNYDTVARGIRKIIDGTVGIRSEYRKLVTTANRENDAGDIDADIADCIVQAGLLGEIVYG